VARLVVDAELGGMTSIERVHQLAECGFKYPIIFTAGIDSESGGVNPGCRRRLLVEQAGAKIDGGNCQSGGIASPNGRHHCSRIRGIFRYQLIR
jgi:hypothetical protein